MVSIKNVSYRFEESTSNALDNVSWDISQGQYACLMGANGSGKTTLLKHLNGLLLPTTGEIIIGGYATSDEKKIKEIRRVVGVVFQNPDVQIIGATVEEDVAFGPENLSLPSAVIQERVEEALSKLGITRLRHRETYTLSGGEKRLVAIAGVLAMAPRVIALDEPTAYLDAPSAQVVLAAIRTLNHEGITIIHITHDFQDAILANNIAVLHDGRVLACGLPTDVLGKKNLLADAGLRMPPLTELFSRLALQGVPVPPIVFGVEEAYGKLMQLLKEKGT